jgi:serine protease Do
MKTGTGRLTGTSIFGMTCATLLVAGLAVPVMLAQGRAPRDPVNRERDRDLDQRAFEFDGLGASIGLTVRDATADEAQRAKLSSPDGAVVTRLRPGGPGEKAGIMTGDIIVDFDGERVRSARQLSRLVRESAAGRPVKSTVARDGGRRTIELTPDDAAWPGVILPDLSRTEEQLRDLAQRFEFDFNDRGGRAWGGWELGPRGRLGATLQPLPEQLAAYFGVPRGVLVSSVETDSPAARAGLRAGDVITAVNSRSVDGASDVFGELRRVDRGGSATITVTRDKKELTLTAQMPDDSRRDGRSRRGRSL